MSYSEMLLDGYEEVKNSNKVYVDFKNYFSKKKKINSIERQISQLENSNRDIQYSIQHTTFQVDDTLPSNGGFEEKTSTSRNIESYIEKKFIDQILSLEKIITKNEKKIFELINIKNILILEITDMSIFIDILGDEYREILDKKFIDGMTLLAIGIELNCSEGCVRKKIEKIKYDYRKFKKSMYIKI